MESIQPEIIYRIAHATRSPARAIAALACSCRSLSSLCRRELWPRYCHERLISSDFWEGLTTSARDGLIRQSDDNVGLTPKLLSYCPGFVDIPCHFLDMGVGEILDEVVRLFDHAVLLNPDIGTDRGATERSPRGGIVALPWSGTWRIVSGLMRILSPGCGASREDDLRADTPMADDLGSRTTRARDTSTNAGCCSSGRSSGGNSAGSAQAATSSEINATQSEQRAPYTGAVIERRPRDFRRHCKRMGVTCHVDEESSFSRASLLGIIPLVDPESASFVVAQRRFHFHLTFMVLRGFIANFECSAVRSVLQSGAELLEGDICPFCPAQIWDAKPVLNSNICDTLECILARITICQNGHIFGLYRR